MDMERDFRPEEEYQDMETGRTADYSDSYAEDYGVDTSAPLALEEADAQEEPEQLYEEDGEQEEYEEAEEPEEAPEAEEPNEVKYHDGLFDYLIDALESGRTVPMSRNKLVDTEKCLSIIEEIRSNFPQTLQQAVKIQKEKDRLLDAAEKLAREKYDKANEKANEILDEAEEHADAIEETAQRKAESIVASANEKVRRMIEDAERRVKRMIDESEVMVAAKQEAAALREEARAEAHETRLKAVNDAWRLFDALEKQTNGISQALRARKNEMNGKA